MWQKSLAVAYSLDRAFVCFCVTSAPSSIAARNEICFRHSASLFREIEERSGTVRQLLIGDLSHGYDYWLRRLWLKMALASSLCLLVNAQEHRCIDRQGYIRASGKKSVVN